MKVKKIHIENYRMLKRIDIDLEENLSLIIGKNNCGKTSFLSILNKFIGSQSSTNNFTYNDFNSDFQDSLFDAINDDQPSWEKLNIKGIELYLFIEYDETDNLSNIQPLMLDLDPDNNIVILKFEYTISEQKFIKLISDFNTYCKKFEKEPDYSKSEVFDIFMRAKHQAKKQGIQIPNDVPFEDAVGLLNWTYKRGPNKGKSHLDVLLEAPSNKMLFEHIKRWPYEKVQKIYLDKSQCRCHADSCSKKKLSQYIASNPKTFLCLLYQSQR